MTTYAATAKRKWGSCLYAWLRGWKDYETGDVTTYRPEYPCKAYAAGRTDRASVNRATMEMLVSQG